MGGRSAALLVLFAAACAGRSVQHDDANAGGTSGDGASGGLGGTGVSSGGSGGTGVSAGGSGGSGGTGVSVGGSTGTGASPGAGGDGGGTTAGTTGTGGSGACPPGADPPPADVTCAATGLTLIRQCIDTVGSGFVGTIDGTTVTMPQSDAPAATGRASLSWVSCLTGEGLTISLEFGPPYDGEYLYVHVSEKGDCVVEGGYIGEGGSQTSVDVTVDLVSRHVGHGPVYVEGTLKASPFDSGVKPQLIEGKFALTTTMQFCLI